MGLWLPLLAACPGPNSQAICTDLCEQLVFDCGYAAFPDAGSCRQGCAYETAEGAEIHPLYSCLLDAGCDTPQVLACSRTYGGVR